MTKKNVSLDSLIRGFRAANLGAFPSLDDYESPQDQALWVLWVAKDKLNTPWLTSKLVAELLSEFFELPVTRRGIGPALHQASLKKLVQGSKREGKDLFFRIMKPGKDYLKGTARNAVRLIDPGKAFEAHKQLRDVFQGLRGTVRVCDPYFDYKTLARLEEFPATCQIQVLTVTVNQSGRTRNACKAYQKQIGNVEVRVHKQRDLHDRYIIHDGGMLLVGTSLNQIGAKQTFIVAVGPDMRRTMLADFDGKWAQAAIFS